MRTLVQKSSGTQKSYVHSNPTHLFAGQLQCKSYGGAIVQVCGKGGGYYGCYNAKRKTCSNKLTVKRSRLEDFSSKAPSRKAPYCGKLKIRL